MQCITKVTFKKGAGKVKTFGTFTVADAIEVDFIILAGTKGDFVSLPSDKREVDGKMKYENKVRAASKDLHIALQNYILKKWQEASANPTPTPEKGSEEAPF